MLIIHLCFCLLGILSCFFLFGHLQTLSSYKKCTASQKISIIIPARNEAHNLPGLLSDIQQQELKPLECICVDDGSTDGTKNVIEDYGMQYIRISHKSSDWQGKTYACHVGANACKGDMLLFLDADVRLEPDALKRLAACYEEEQSVISVQPFHKTIKLYEQLSFLFNCIVMAMAGSSRVIQRAPGLFGPVIFMSRTQYAASGGHDMVKKDVLDDIGLGECVKNAAIPYRRFSGKGVVNFRMYPGGVQEVVQGWVKNFAEGAVRISIPLLILAALWITSLIRTVMELIKHTVDGSTFWMLLFLTLYFVIAGQLLWVSHQVGAFRSLGMLLYPLLLIGFLLIFAISVIKKVFHIPVYWKGRRIKTGG